MTSRLGLDRRGRLGTCGLLAAIAILASSALGAEAKGKPPMPPLPPREAAIAGIAAHLETADPFHIVRPGEEAKARFTIANSQSAPAKVRLEVEIESWEGDKVSRNADLDVPAGATVFWPLPKDALGALGHKTLRYHVTVGGEVSSDAEQMLVYLTPTGRAAQHGPGTLFGLAFGAGRDNTDENSALVADWLGLDIVRLHLPWSHMEPKPGEFQWDDVDKVIGQYEAHGIQIQALFSGTPAWALKDKEAGAAARERGEKTESRAPDPQAWETFTGQYAARFRGRVAYYEIWNEPDLEFWTGTDDEYLELLRGAYRAIKAADPRAVVMTGGFAGGGQTDRLKPAILERTLTEARDSFDVIAYHRHGFFKDFAKEIQEKLLSLRERTGNAAKPLYFTETAMDSRKGLRHQAETLVKKISFTSSLGAIAHTWFNLHDASTGSLKSGYSYGLLSSDGEPKTSFAAYNTLTGLLRGKTPMARLATAEGVWALPFQGEKETIVVCWREDDKAPAELRLQTDARGAETVDIMGNAKPLALSSQSVALTLSSTPVYVRLQGASRVAMQ